MADNQSTMDRIGLTRGKAALIGVLGVALMGVLYLQYGGSEEPSAGVAADHRPRVPASLQPARAAEPAQAKVDLQAKLAAFDQRRWQSPELAEVVAYDPFALPAAFPQPLQPILASTSAAEQAELTAAAKADQLARAVDRLREQLEELQRRGVHVIVSERDQFVAMIGDQTVQVGDEIEGFTVTEIDLDGVRVERKGVE